MREYYDTTFTHNYVIGAKINGMVVAYLITLNFEALCMFFASFTTSRGYTVARYSSNKKKIQYLEEHCTRRIELIDLETFESTRRTRVNKKGKEYVENRGEYFEYLVSQFFGVEQNDVSNLKHTEGGDIEIDKIAYQVKYEASGICLGK